MLSELHSFHSYFVLVKNTKNRENALHAVYLSQYKNKNQGNNRNDNLVLNEPVEPQTEEQEQEWNTFVEEWIRAIENENKFDNSDDEILLTDEMNNDFNFGGRIIHPADDPTAKQPLATLFVSNLESPTYLETDQIYSAL